MRGAGTLVPSGPPFPEGGADSEAKEERKGKEERRRAEQSGTQGACVGGSQTQARALIVSPNICISESAQHLGVQRYLKFI